MVKQTMNGKQIIILKEALDNVNKEIYESMPLAYAEKAVEIIQDNIIKTINKLMNKS